MRDELAVEALHQSVVERSVAEQEARFQQRGADRHVGRRLAQALVDRARRVADLQLEIPQHVEHRLDDALAPGGLLVGKQEQQVDVRPRRQRAAAVAAGGDDREALARGRIARPDRDARRPRRGSCARPVHVARTAAVRRRGRPARRAAASRPRRAFGRGSAADPGTRRARRSPVSADRALVQRASGRASRATVGMDNPWLAWR